MTQRPLYPGQALACENAVHPRCKCRCGGKLHGARRNTQQLPEDDPHLEVAQQRFEFEEVSNWE